MMNLFYEPFPDCVSVGDKACPVVTDFREWIRFHDLVSDKNVPDRSKIFLLADWFLNPPAFMTDAHICALLDFYLAKALAYEPESDEEEAPEPPSFRPPVFDWCIDAQFLLADFRRFYQIDLLTVPYLHWWEFRSLFYALPKESHCQERIYYRSVELSQISDKNEKKRIRKIKKAIALPYEMSDEMIGASLMGAF